MTYGRTAGWLASGLWFALIIGLLLPHPQVDAADGKLAKSRRALARIELGRRLFFDPAASQSGTTSCASCHDPKHGFSDPARFSDDEQGTTARRSQPLLDGRFNPSAHRDGEFASIEGLVASRLGTPRTTSAPPYYVARGGRRGPALTPGKEPVATEPTLVELRKTTGRLPNRMLVAERLEEAGRYARAFSAAFGTRSITLPKIAIAMADYCRSIESTEAPIDRFLAGDSQALDSSAQRGLSLFRGRAGCAKCHSMDVHENVGRPLFTDFAFHNTGIAEPPDEPERRLFGGVTLSPTGSRIRSGPSVAERAAMGRFFQTRDRKDLGAFKTPTLRDVAKRAPYMHDGRMQTLAEVVRYYADGCGGKPGLDKHIKKFEVTDGDVADLVALLESLSGETQPGLANDAWRRGVKKTTLKFKRADKPAAGIRVVLEGAGAVIPRAGPARVVLETDKSGRVRFTPGPFTHMRVVEPPVRDGESAWIPDTCRVAEVSFVDSYPTKLLLTVGKDTDAPRQIVADRVDGGASVCFYRVAKRSANGIHTYRAWTKGRDIQVRFRDTVVESSADLRAPETLKLIAKARDRSFMVKPRGTLELRLVQMIPGR